MADTYNFEYSFINENGERQYLVKKEELSEKEVLRTLFSVVKNIPDCIYYFGLYKYFTKESTFEAFVNRVKNEYNLSDPFALHIYNSQNTVVISIDTNSPTERYYTVAPSAFSDSSVFISADDFRSESLSSLRERIEALEDMVNDLFRITQNNRER